MTTQKNASSSQQQQPQKNNSDLGSQQKNQQGKLDSNAKPAAQKNDWSNKQ